MRGWPPTRPISPSSPADRDVSRALSARSGWSAADAAPEDEQKRRRGHQSPGQRRQLEKREQRESDNARDRAHDVEAVGVERAELAEGTRYAVAEASHHGSRKDEDDHKAEVPRQRPHAKRTHDLVVARQLHVASGEDEHEAHEQRERNRPVTLDAALERLGDPRAVLLINERSGRAAVQVPTASLILDDGDVERRVRLIRPMEAPNVPLKTMVESHWTETDRETFAATWTAEVAEVPAFTDITIHIVAGLLLPIWKRLPNESTRVYRLQTDTGERIIGRKVSPAWVAGAMATGVTILTPQDAFAALMDGRTIIDLAEHLQLRRVRVMGANRIELSGFTDAMRDRLTAYGLFHEIISWKLRMFVPTDTNGADVLAKVLERFPVGRIGERDVA